MFADVYRYFSKQVFLKAFQISYETPVMQSLFINVAVLRAYSYFKRDSNTDVFL